VQSGPGKQRMPMMPATMVRLAARCLWRRQNELKSGASTPFWESFDSIAALLDHLCEAPTSCKMSFAALCNHMKYALLFCTEASCHYPHLCCWYCYFLHCTVALVSSGHASLFCLCCTSAHLLPVPRGNAGTSLCP
jgi:hypothetical protein